jgi:sortase A
MKAERGKLLMLIGALLILSAVLLVSYNIWTDRAAGVDAERVLWQVQAQLPGEALPEDPLRAQRLISLAADGDSYIGVLELPALELALPVMRTWSYPNLKTAPCRYTGSAAEGSLIIAAHNYDSHFGLLKTLEAGDAVLFTDVDGRLYAYEVSQLETLGGGDVEEMRAGDWDLTLFTCTLGGQRRVTIRCTLAE